MFLPKKLDKFIGYLGVTLHYKVDTNVWSWVSCDKRLLKTFHPLVKDFSLLNFNFNFEMFQIFLIGPVA